jgi:hypothetical protein
VSPPGTASGASTTYSSPATLPANTIVTLNAIAAADTTKISTATITLTNGVIEFIPASLSFTCKILILGAAKQQWDVTEFRLWNNLQGPRLAVNLPQTEHVALSDWIWLTRDAV